MARPDALSFTYEAQGLTRCFRPNTRFRGFVDYDNQTVVLRAADGTPLAVIAGGAALVRSSLFAEPPPATWMRIPKNLDGPGQAALRSALGAEFASYLVDGASRSTPAEVALAALEAGGEVAEKKTASGSRFQIVVDATKLDDAEEAAGIDSPESESGVGVVVGVEFAGAVISAISVGPTSPRASGEEGAEAPIGWTTTYDRSQPSRETQLPETQDNVELASGTVRTLRPAAITTCEVKP
jgi:hypothetical protein